MNYKNILTTSKKVKTNKNIIPHGWTLIRRENNKIVHYNNFNDEYLNSIQYKYEAERQYQLYKETIARMVRYKIEELDRENIEYDIDEVYDYIIEQTEIIDENCNDEYDENEYSDNECYSDNN